MTGRMLQHSITEVKQNTDIIELIQKQVPLTQKPEWDTWCGECPLCEGTDFRVKADPALFYCGTCGEAGDAIYYVQKHQKVTFSEAVQQLATEAGITLEYEPAESSPLQEGLKELLKDLEMTNTSIVDAIIAVDMNTLTRAVETRDTSIIRMKDGKKPSEEQFRLLMKAEPSHYKAAQREYRVRADRARTSAWAAERAAQLTKKYAQFPDETVGEIAKRMSQGDREELRSLMLILAEDPEVAK